MPPFPKPRFRYAIDLATELAALRNYERDQPGRQIPDKREQNLLLATWNVANLGVQQRAAVKFRRADCSGFISIASPSGLSSYTGESDHPERGRL